MGVFDKMFGLVCENAERNGYFELNGRYMGGLAWWVYWARSVMGVTDIFVSIGMISGMSVKSSTGKLIVTNMMGLTSGVGMMGML